MSEGAEQNWWLEIVAAVGFTVCFVTGVYVADKPSFAGALFGALFVGFFVALPFVVLYLFGRLLVHPVLRMTAMAGMVAVTVFWLWAWYTTFIDNAQPDAQDGLVIVVAPIYAAGGALLLGLVLLLFNRK